MSACEKANTGPHRRRAQAVEYYGGDPMGKLIKRTHETHPPVQLRQRESSVLSLLHLCS